MDIRDELISKTALMRSLGVVEMDTASGYVRRIVLSPLPEGSALPALPALPEPELKPIGVDEDEVRRKKIEARTFGKR